MVLTIIEVITLPSKSKLKIEESSTWVVKVYDVYHRKSKVDQQKKVEPDHTKDIWNIDWLGTPYYVSSRLKIFPEYVSSLRKGQREFSERLLETG